MQLPVIGSRREAVPDQEKIASACEIRAGDEKRGVGADVSSQIAQQRRRMPTLRHPDMPALVEVWLGSHVANGLTDLGGQIPLVTDLEKSNLPHHTLPPNQLKMDNWQLTWRNRVSHLTVYGEAAFSVRYPLSTVHYQTPTENLHRRDVGQRPIVIVLTARLELTDLGPKTVIGSCQKTI